MKTDVKKRLTTVTNMCCWLLFVGLAIGGAEAQVQAQTSTTDRIQMRTYDFEEANEEMSYALFVPSTYDAAQAHPLIVLLHGLRSNPRQVIGYAGLTGLAEQHGYIVAAPYGYNERGWYGSRGPGRSPIGRRGNGDAGADDPENLGDLSEKDVMNVLGIVRDEFNVDPNRVYLMGHSMGGGGTWHLGIKYPEIWAGLGPVAPAIYASPDALEAITHIPVIVVQGTEDRLVPVRGTRSWTAKMEELDMDYEYIEVEGGGHIDVITPNLENMGRIFAFFNARRKSAQSAGNTRAPQPAPAGRTAEDDERAVSDARVQHRSYEMTEAGGEEIPYALFVPTTYDADTPSALIIGLHGRGRTYDWLMGYEGILVFAERDGYIMATPLGYTRRAWYGSRDNGRLGELSEADVMNVLELVREEFNIDEKRIYLWGHSMGGAGTYHLAQKHPDLWAALGVAAPAPSRSPETLEAYKHIPIIALQGDQDRLVTPMRQWVAKMKELGMEHVYIEIAGGDHSRFISMNPETLGKLFSFFNIVSKDHRGSP